MRPPRIHAAPVPLWRQALERWPAELREEWDERSALVYDGCRSEGVTMEHAERLAWDQISERERRRRG